MSGSGALRFQVGARTLGEIPRRLRHVGLSLDQALAEDAPALPPIDAREDGYLVTSLPDRSAIGWPGIVHVRQRYRRHYIDLSVGEAAWRAGLSSSTQAGGGERRPA